MPTINKKKICGKHGIYNAIESPQCPKCKKVSNKTYDNTMRAKDRTKIYNSRQWKNIRVKALVRDEFMCVMCRANGIDTKAEEVDHILELQDRQDLAFDLDNLQSLCKPCHSKKTAKEKEERGL